MQSASSYRSVFLITLIFCLTLAILGFQAAGWWGVLAGGLVGTVIVSRILLRGAAEPAPASAHALVVPDAAANAATFHTAVSAAKRPVLH